LLFGTVGRPLIFRFVANALALVGAPKPIDLGDEGIKGDGAECPVQSRSVSGIVGQSVEYNPDVTGNMSIRTYPKFAKVSYSSDR